METDLRIDDDLVEKLVRQQKMTFVVNSITTVTVAFLKTYILVGV